MATSMQFGPEWMRKAATRSSSSIAVKDPASPNPNSFPDAAGSPLAASGVFGSAAGGHAGASNGVPGSAAAGAFPAASPAVASPSGFSFAEAAAGLSGDREPRDRDRSSGTVTMGSSRLRLLKRGLTDGAPPSPSLTASSQPASPTIQATSNQLPSTNHSNHPPGGAASSPAGANASGPGATSAGPKTSNPNSASPGAGRGPGGAWPGSRLHRQRSLAEGGGPIGPPADGSAGFHKFAGYDRKRERQHSAVTSNNGSGAAPDSTPRSPNPDAKELEGDTSITQAPEPEKSEWSPETAFWLYKDPSGQVQGPFNAVSMQEWYKQRYFTADLLVKRQEEDEFTMLGVVLALIGDTSTPFLQPPRPKQTAPPGSPGLSTQSEPPAPEQTSGPVDPGANDGTPTFQANGGISEQAHVEPDAGIAQPPLQQRRPWPNLDLDLTGYGGPNGPGSAGHGFGSNGVPRSPFTASAALLGMSPHAARQTAVAPGSPFAIPSVANLALDDRLRQQDELLAFARQRELQEQRQAAAAAAARAGFGVAMPPLGADSFGGLHAGPVRRPGWEDMPPSAGAMPASPAPWQQFGLPPQNLTGSAIGGPPAGSFFESFGQSPRPIGPGHNAPWTASSPMTPARMPFDRPLPQETVEDPFVNHTPNHVGSPSPWPTPAPVHQPTSSHVGEISALPAQQMQGDARFNGIDSTTIAPAVAPVGTPRRSVSPAPPSAQPDRDVSQDAQVTQEPPVVAQEISAESPAESEPEPVPAQAEEETQPELQPTELPADDPEELWPADPSAVEFAPEQSFDDNAAAKAKLDDSASALAARRTRRGARQLRADGTEDDRDDYANNQSTGSVRVVGQDQFKRGGAAGASVNSVEAPLSAWLPDASGQGQTPSSATFAKPAPWASKAEDETTSSSGPSLREIQAAEARNAEVKRSRAAAERAAKASLASVTSPGGTDSTLPATMSWGLASVPPSGPKEAPIVPAAQSGGNAWQAKAAAASSGAPKKTLMEIQEEERKRAQRQSEIRSAQAAAVRKGYADSASRSISNPAPSIAAVAQTAAVAAPSGGGAWSVVGAGGKTAGTPLAAPPGVTRAVSGTPQRVASGPAANGWTTAKPAAGIKAAAPSSTVASIVSNGVRKASGRPTSAAGADAGSATQPSPEFLQYCKDHLKGLNIRVDDFIEMLLSFPLDPSPDVIEIIAESVYANSSTLDGRRFASDFVAKRKLDAQGRFANGQSSGHGFGGFDGSSTATGSGAGAAQGGAGAGGAWTPAGSSGRTASEVLKSQPAASKNESPFGFKVVKAKGNKKRN